MSRAQIFLSALTAMTFAAMSLMANAADVSVNGGWSSAYIFRGMPQSDSSEFAGLDIEHSGFYFGTWAADVGESGQVPKLLTGGAALVKFRYEISTIRKSPVAVQCTVKLYPPDSYWVHVNFIGWHESCLFI